jgi:hypothetical protein
MMSIQLVQERSHKEAGHGLDRATFRSTAQLGGYTTLAGTVTMLIGAVLWGTSGTDLWAALDTGDMAGYLAAAGTVKAQLVTNLSVWILGTFIIGIAGTMLAALSTRRRTLAQTALVCYQTAVPLVIVSYIAMLAIIVQLGGDTSATAVSLAEVVGWIGARADDLATALILGAAPLLLSLAGHKEWAPTWLLRWGYLTALAGLFSIMVLYLPGMAAYGFIILPIGMGWMLATSIVLLRRAKAAA